MKDMPADFTPWHGESALPPITDGFAIVEVWFRMGRTSHRPRAVWQWVWKHSRSPEHSGGDIIGWRRALPPPPHDDPSASHTSRDHIINTEEA